MYGINAQKYLQNISDLYPPLLLIPYGTLFLLFPLEDKTLIIP